METRARAQEKTDGDIQPKDQVVTIKVDPTLMLNPELAEAVESLEIAEPVEDEGDADVLEKGLRKLLGESMDGETAVEVHNSDDEDKELKSAEVTPKQKKLVSNAKVSDDENSSEEEVVVTPVTSKAAKKKEKEYMSEDEGSEKMLQLMASVELLLKQMRELRKSEEKSFPGIKPLLAEQATIRIQLTKDIKEYIEKKLQPSSSKGTVLERYEKVAALVETVRALAARDNSIVVQAYKDFPSVLEQRSRVLYATSYAAKYAMSLWKKEAQAKTIEEEVLERPRKSKTQSDQYMMAAYDKIDLWAKTQPELSVKLRH